MSKKIIITEQQLKELEKINEMAYPTFFNMNEFKSLPTFSARIKYCESKLQRISSGSSRIVYKIDDEKVLKLAKNKKGIAQNEVEDDYYLQQIGCFAEVYDVDENHQWIEMQLARRPKVSDFKRIFGYGFDVICAWIDYCANSYGASYVRNVYYNRNEKYDKLFNSPEFEENYEYSIFEMLQHYLGDYQINESTGDLKRISSWGLVKNNGQDDLVLIDFGLSDKVFNDYYR